ncbi:UpxY family transcription antiterminator [Spirosoma panaciterrae]|uniref:UpxY family transcription antiterminator n=1 Tax=Spirosoma panaciterrae TaxID=496058 RepID=UPI00035CD3AC|nr:UpxY family transcription antiterminator [Spirosoma panaciterrae]
MPWFVLYTKSRSEKLVARGLIQKGIQVYCPLRKVKRKWSDRFKIVEEPLFRSYCFVHLEENERASVFGVPGVVGYLHWLKKPAIVKPKEIDLIRDMLNDFDHDSLEVVNFDAADRLKITSGAFMDQEGEVVSANGKRLMIKLDSLSMFIAIDISKTKVEKIKTSKLFALAMQKLQPVY